MTISFFDFYCLNLFLGLPLLIISSLLLYLYLYYVRHKKALVCVGLIFIHMTLSIILSCYIWSIWDKLHITKYHDDIMLGIILLPMLLYHILLGCIILTEYVIYSKKHPLKS